MKNDFYNKYKNSFILLSLFIFCLIVLSCAKENESFEQKVISELLNRLTHRFFNKDDIDHIIIYDNKYIISKETKKYIDIISETAYLYEYKLLKTTQLKNKTIYLLGLYNEENVHSNTYLFNLLIIEITKDAISIYKYKPEIEKDDKCDKLMFCYKIKRSVYDDFINEITVLLTIKKIILYNEIPKIIEDRLGEQFQFTTKLNKGEFTIPKSFEYKSYKVLINENEVKVIDVTLRSDINQIPSIVY